MSALSYHRSEGTLHVEQATADDEPESHTHKRRFQ